MKRILIIDDEAMIATELEDILKSMGFDVIDSAAVGAIKMAVKYSPNLILTDILLPKKNGSIAASQIIYEKMNIPVLFITSYPNDELIQKTNINDPFAYILKPFNEVQIKAAIEIAMCKKEMEHRFPEAYKYLLFKIKERTAELIETKTALRVMLKKLDEERRLHDEKVVSNIKSLIIPYLEKMKAGKLSDRQKANLDIIEKNISEVVSPFVHDISSGYFKLSPTEIQISNLIMQGMTTKEIAEIKSLSAKTIESHRKNIRKKTEIINKKVNLRTQLLSIKNKSVTLYGQ